jgi:hypothetical protein
VDLQEFVDRQHILERLYKYCDLLDCGRPQDVAVEVFTDDVVEDHGEGLPVHHGAAALVEYLTKALEPFAGCMHLLTNHVISVDGDHATSTSYYLALHWFAQDGVGAREADWISAGRYVDSWRRTPQGWRVEARRRENVGPSSVVAGVRPDHLVAMRRPSHPRSLK